MDMGTAGIWKRPPWARAALTLGVAVLVYCTRRGLTAAGCFGRGGEGEGQTFWSYDRAGGWG